MASLPHSGIRLGLPKGRMNEAVVRLLADAGIHLRAGVRDYRPTISLAGFEVKVLKPQSIVEMLHVGSRDLGFAGADWVAELNAEVVELLDTGLDPVRLVAAIPHELLAEGGTADGSDLTGSSEGPRAASLDKPHAGTANTLKHLPQRALVIASEYENLTKAWIRERRLNATFVHSYGATEVLPPEDADVIVDNTATGSTLAANGLVIIDELLRSSTRLYAHPAALEDRTRREAVDRLVLLLKSVLEARGRVMLEVNVSAAQLEAVIGVLPCMREPTIARLHGDSGYAVKAAVPRDDLPRLIPEIKARGGTDIVVTRLAQIVP